MTAPVEKPSGDALSDTPRTDALNTAFCDQHNAYCAGYSTLDVDEQDAYIKMRDLAETLERELNALRAAPPAQGSGEAVAWMSPDKYHPRIIETTASKTIADDWRVRGWKVTPLYASPQPAQPSSEARAVVLLREFVSGGDKDAFWATNWNSIYKRAVVYLATLPQPEEKPNA